VALVRIHDSIRSCVYSDYHSTMASCVHSCQECGDSGTTLLPNPGPGVEQTEDHLPILVRRGFSSKWGVPVRNYHHLKHRWIVQQRFRHDFHRGHSGWGYRNPLQPLIGEVAVLQLSAQFPVQGDSHFYFPISIPLSLLLVYTKI
jgi:hypothetical protein